MNKLKDLFDQIKLNNADKETLYENILNAPQRKKKTIRRNLAIGFTMAFALVLTVIITPQLLTKRMIPVNQRLVLDVQGSTSMSMLAFDPTDCEILVNGFDSTNPTYPGSEILILVKVKSVDDAVFFTDEYPNDQTRAFSEYWHPYTPVQLQVNRVVRGHVPDNLGTVYISGGYVSLQEYTKRFHDPNATQLSEQDKNGYIYFTSYFDFPEVEKKYDELLQVDHEYLLAIDPFTTPDGRVVYGITFMSFGIFTPEGDHYINVVTGKSVIPN